MKKLNKTLLMGVIAVFLAACASNNDGNENESEQNEESETITVEHELGETEVDKNPEKVIVFDFGSLDTLDKLDIDVTGVPQKNVPEYLDKYEDDTYENIGALKEPDFEKIAEIDPDLIIISGRQSDVYDQLQELGPTVFLGVDTERYMDSFTENVETIGEIFDKEEEAEQELKSVEDHIAEVQEKAEEADKDGLIILANDDKISAYGPASRFGLIHDVFGVPASDEDIEVSTHGKNVSFEYVVEQDPDLLYVVDRSAAIGEGASAKQVVENSLMEDTKAMQNDDIIYLDPDYWYLSGGGLISVDEMVDEIETSLE